VAKREAVISDFGNPQRRIFTTPKTGNRLHFHSEFSLWEVVGLVDTFVYISAGVILTIAAHFFLERISSFTELSIYEVPNDMVPVERELLEEILANAGAAPVANPEMAMRLLQMNPRELRHYRYQRKRLRLDLDAIQVRLRRILANAARPKHWAIRDERMIKEKKLEYGPEVSEGIKQVLVAQRELSRLVVWVLFRIWLWNLTAFQTREWGPIPDVRKLRVGEILEAYEKLKHATVNLARSYGEAGVAEEIAAVM
jgi:hypothetical protein